jgi:hypothetical protein
MTAKITVARRNLDAAAQRGSRSGSRRTNLIAMTFPPMVSTIAMNAAVVTRSDLVGSPISSCIPGEYIQGIRPADLRIPSVPGVGFEPTRPSRDKRF